ncbi:Mut7-C RNAse domain-containing protein [Halogeometricum sp. S1BR25-6]|uniref:Mut7-C RNAse domain-containing protein n=1 Tax=Halogeometricum salsisoli TaxID=2950536 RepID=A0ABU2GB00_9EURY|nr:Mut7-C RNAse domain-containing protein [Halogeometricum sp. S1BR25-6]MDS0297972.1 Mut7-C RNAse domain-containing protein [Halogeometricum sp. S1BR25-6]
MVDPDAEPISVSNADSLLLDSMLGKLATYLRMCGYDAAYVLDDGPDPGDDAVLERAREEGRTLVTRDERLAARADESVLLSSKAVTDQLAEFAAAGYSPRLGDRPTRCGSCNGPVAPVDAGESVPEYAPDPDERPLWRCRDCGQVFWRGSHWADVAARLDAVR